MPVDQPGRHPGRAVRMRVMGALPRPCGSTVTTGSGPDGRFPRRRCVSDCTWVLLRHACGVGGSVLLIGRRCAGLPDCLGRAALASIPQCGLGAAPTADHWSLVGSSPGRPTRPSGQAHRPAASELVDRLPTRPADCLTGASPALRAQPADKHRAGRRGVRRITKIESTLPHANCRSLPHGYPRRTYCAS